MQNLQVRRKAIDSCARLSVSVIPLRHHVSAELQATGPAIEQVVMCAALGEVIRDETCMSNGLRRVLESELHHQSCNVCATELLIMLPSQRSHALRTHDQAVAALRQAVSWTAIQRCLAELQRLIREPR